MPGGAPMIPVRWEIVQSCVLLCDSGFEWLSTVFEFDFT